MGAQAGLADAVAADLRQLLAIWRELIFPRQVEAHPVRGRWRPTSAGEQLAFWLWTGVGVPLIAVVYPLALVGFGARYVTRRINSAVAALGLLTVVGVVAVAWGGLTVVAWVRFPRDGFLAVLSASVVATLSAGLGWLFARLGGRVVTVVFAYPFAVAALFLPPVTAALFSPALGDTILPGSYSLAVWLLENVLAVGNINAYLRRYFRLEGFGFLGMWFGLAVPVGWVVGLVVTLADAVRPKPGSEE